VEMKDEGDVAKKKQETEPPVVLDVLDVVRVCLSC